MIFLNFFSINSEIRKITGMHPKLYATFDHQGFINNNVIDPKWPPS